MAWPGTTGKRATAVIRNCIHPYIYTPVVYCMYSRRKRADVMVLLLYPRFLGKSRQKANTEAASTGTTAVPPIFLWRADTNESLGLDTHWCRQTSALLTLSSVHTTPLLSLSLSLGVGADLSRFEFWRALSTSFKPEQRAYHRRPQVRVAIHRCRLLLRHVIAFLSPVLALSCPLPLLAVRTAVIYGQ